MITEPYTDAFFEQAANICKAQGYDILSDEVKRLRDQNQLLYDSLMKLANDAYEKSQVIKYSLPVSLQWLGKAEAYESAANLVNYDKTLVTQLSDRQKDINEAREEDAQAEAQYEMNETEE